MKTVFVGLSGGVDSSVSAALLQEQGYRVIGVHLRCFNVDGCAEKDAEDARRAAETLGIPFYVFDLEEAYKERVVQYMIDGYRRGITPNPDVMCNKEIKFGLFFERAMELGADYVATGHYAQEKNGRIFAGADENKDQSYFLWTLTKEQLKKTKFPIGGYKKSKVRTLAKKYKLHNAEKKDSQGICFLGHVKIPDFLAEYIPNKKGDILSIEGEKVGEHSGAYYYTIGQRHGLGVGGLSVPHFVTEKDVKKNTVTIAPEGHPALLSQGVVLQSINVINETGLSKKDILVRVRYRQPLVKATLERSGKNMRIVFKEPQRHIARGQSAVLYLPRIKDGKKTVEMIAGGEIKERF